jgi:hypothetical protein
VEHAARAVEMTNARKHLAGKPEDKNRPIDRHRHRKNGRMWSLLWDVMPPHWVIGGRLIGIALLAHLGCRVVTRKDDSMTVKCVQVWSGVTWCGWGIGDGLLWIWQ